ncbi:MAG: succinyl-diaminopimelate desuccinylase, partial [Rhizobiales bacterium]|nr:succinyl-diaminopimelate desuccinylase [Hyphomicrobiales bacterium]
DEEGPAINGTVKLLQWAKENGHSFDHCIVGEPTNVEMLGDMIKIGRRGSFSGTITITGQQGHVAYPHLAKNPISGMARMIELLTFEPLDAGSEHFQPSNLEIVNLDSSNRAWNVIPGKAELRFNIRFNNHWDAGKLEQIIRQRMADCAGETGLEITLALEPVVSDVFLTEPGHLVDILTNAIHDVTGVQPELSTNGGTSDARFIKDYCPVIEFGLVNRTIHQTNEHVSLDDLKHLTEIYYRMIAGYFSNSEA